MKILHTVPTLSRRAGGLPVAVVALCDQLGDVSLLTEQPSDAIDVPDTIRLVNDFEKVDLIHQHGLWSPSTMATSRFALKNDIPLVISPHGMLEPWALKHHGGRKKIAWALYQHRYLRSAAGLHATCQAEADHLRELGLENPLSVIPHGIPMTPLSARNPNRKVLFLSRIHEKKGIDLLLDAWEKIDTTGWELQISGPDEGWNVPSLPENVDVTGALYETEKEAAFAESALFVLPSHSENFGLVVAEALQREVPVITTTGTPWGIIEEAGCGWCVEPTVSAIAEALTEAFTADLPSMGERGRELIAQEFSPESAVAKIREFYDNLLQ